MPARNASFSSNGQPNATQPGNKGTYDNQAGGAKAFGNDKQGPNAPPRKMNGTQPDCQDRMMMVAVTSTSSSNTNGTNLVLQLTALNFASTTNTTNSTDTGSNASLLTMSFAALVGLLTYVL